MCACALFCLAHRSTTTQTYTHPDTNHQVMSDPRERERAILDAAPHFRERPKLLNRLVQQPVGGNAWHADHVVMVAEGGGECGADNARTLCVICHAGVTAEQARAKRGRKRGGQSLVLVVMAPGGPNPPKRTRPSSASSSASSAGTVAGVSAAREGEENGGDGANRARPFVGMT